MYREIVRELILENQIVENWWIILSEIKRSIVRSLSLKYLKSKKPYLYFTHIAILTIIYAHVISSVTQ